jgi:hypothetical protein
MADSRKGELAITVLLLGLLPLLGELRRCAYAAANLSVVMNDGRMGHCRVPLT